MENQGQAGSGSTQMLLLFLLGASQPCFPGDPEQEVCPLAGNLFPFPPAGLCFQ